MGFRGAVIAALWLWLWAGAPAVIAQRDGALRTGTFTVVATTPSVSSPTPVAEEPAMAPAGSMPAANSSMNSTVGINATGALNVTGGTGSVDEDLDAEIIDNALGTPQEMGEADAAQEDERTPPVDVPPPAEASGPSTATGTIDPADQATSGDSNLIPTDDGLLTVVRPSPSPAPPVALGPSPSRSPPFGGTTLPNSSSASPPATAPPLRLTGPPPGAAPSPAPASKSPSSPVAQSPHAAPSPQLAKPPQLSLPSRGAAPPQGALSPNAAPSPRQELSIRQAVVPEQFAESPGAAPTLGEFAEEPAEGPVALPPEAILVAAAPVSQMQVEDMEVTLEVQMAISSGDPSEAAEVFVETETVTGVADGLRAPPEFTVEAFPEDAPLQEKDPDVVAAKGVAIAVVQAIDSDPQIVERMADAIIESALPKPPRRFCTTGDPNRPDWWYAHVGGTRSDWTRNSDAKCLGSVTFNPVGWGEEPCVSGSTRSECERSLNIAIETCKPILKEIAELGVNDDPQYCGVVGNTYKYVNRTILLEKLRDKELMMRVQDLDPSEGQARRRLKLAGPLRHLLVSSGRNVDSLYCARCWPKDVCEDTFAFCKPKPKKNKCKKGKKGKNCRKGKSKKSKDKDKGNKSG